MFHSAITYHIFTIVACRQFVESKLRPWLVLTCITYELSLYTRNKNTHTALMTFLQKKASRVTSIPLKLVSIKYRSNCSRDTGCIYALYALYAKCVGYMVLVWADSRNTSHIYHLKFENYGLFFSNQVVS